MMEWTNQRRSSPWNKHTLCQDYNLFITFSPCWESRFNNQKNAFHYDVISLSAVTVVHAAWLK